MTYVEFKTYITFMTQVRIMTYARFVTYMLAFMCCIYDVRYIHVA